MNLSDSNQVANFYEQMLMQRNLSVRQQQNESLHLQILNKSASSNSSASSTSSLLSISSKSQQASPNNSLISDKSESPESKSKPTDYESNNYQTYMMNAAAAAAAAAATFPYSLFNNFNSTMNSSTPIIQQNIPKQFPQQNIIFSSNQVQQSQPIKHHHYHHSNQNIYRPNGNSEEAKPTHSYIGLIALAILSTPEKKLVLSDIYQWILDNYSYFHTRGSGWRNSIRHNLSLNDCFMKSGRSSNGKGHYWTIHPANMEDFVKGDFRRRRAQRRVRKSLGLTVPEEDEEDEDILTPPSSLSPVQQKQPSFNNQMNNSLIMNSPHYYFDDKNKFNFYNFQSNFNTLKRNFQEDERDSSNKKTKIYENETISEIESLTESESEEIDIVNSNNSFNKDVNINPKKRSFNVDSLLAPDLDTSPKKLKNEEIEKNPSDILSKTIKINKKENDEYSSNCQYTKIESSNDEDVEKWKQTFSKIMARSYKNNQSSQHHHHQIGGLINKK
ncbi:unnamed protein product [Brachionus calyciflorus]|uniref:Fork-head domain-containing protein n=1 Tax=Brachionus calyciflorus TaxID=104777 RepID=A0A813YR69_9BILA|nr:unnamed protein product [Brachionus calyciflorus]